MDAHKAFATVSDLKPSRHYSTFLSLAIIDVPVRHLAKGHITIGNFGAKKENNI